MISTPDFLFTPYWVAACEVNSLPCLKGDRKAPAPGYSKSGGSEAAHPFPYYSRSESKLFVKYLEPVCVNLHLAQENCQPYIYIHVRSSVYLIHVRSCLL